MGKKVIVKSQDGSMKAKSYPTRLDSLSNGMTGLVEEGRGMDIVYLDISKVFSTVSYKILVDEPMKYGLDKQTVRWTKNCLELSSSEGCHLLAWSIALSQSTGITLQALICIQHFKMSSLWT